MIQFLPYNEPLNPYHRKEILGMGSYLNPGNEAFKEILQPDYVE